MLIFVYGTLMSGLTNHTVMQNPTFRGKAVTKDKYSLYCSGIPYMSKKNAHTQIQGELYEVDEEDLKRVDILEGHPRFYKRTTIPVINDQNEEVLIEAYICNPPNRAILEETGNYRNYVKKLSENKI
jgi:gamma-glutamylcyclotransferase (GGCT)/AIG2-like uncharacterized protein YtfP